MCVCVCVCPCDRQCCAVQINVLFSCKNKHTLHCSTFSPEPGCFQVIKVETAIVGLKADGGELMEEGRRVAVGLVALGLTPLSRLLPWVSTPSYLAPSDATRSIKH